MDILRGIIAGYQTWLIWSNSSLAVWKGGKNRKLTGSSLVSRGLSHSWNDWSLACLKGTQSWNGWLLACPRGTRSLSQGYPELKLLSPCLSQGYSELKLLITRLSQGYSGAEITRFSQGYSWAETTDYSFVARVLGSWNYWLLACPTRIRLESKYKDSSLRIQLETRVYIRYTRLESLHIRLESTNKSRVYQ